MTLNRRKFLVGLGGVALPVALSGCGFTGSSSGASSSSGGSGTQTLNFTTWGTDAGIGRSAGRDRRIREGQLGGQSRPQRRAVRADVHQHRRTAASRQSTRRLPRPVLHVRLLRRPWSVARPEPAPGFELRRSIHPRGLGGDAEQGKAVRRPAPHRHVRHLVQQDNAGVGRHHRYPHDIGQSLDLGPVEPGGQDAAQQAAGR